MTRRASRAQQRLWFVAQLGEPVPNISVENRYAGRLDAGVLRAAVADLLARHESLRTSLQVRDNELWQVVSTPPDEPPVTLVDLTGAHDVERAYRELCDRVGTAAFDLGTAPLLRMVHVHLGPHSDALVIVLHHAVADAISVEILMRDLTTAYERRLAGRAPDWPEPTVRYADFTAWQEEQAVHQDLGGPAEPDRPLRTFPGVSDTEPVEPPAATEGLVHELISDWAARTPDAPAVVWAGGSLGFAGLDAAANRLAHTLRERGVGPEVPVLVAVPGSAELLVALLGVLKAGGVYVPVDPAAPAADLLGITIHCGASFVLTTAGAEVALPASVVLRVDAVPPAVDPGAPDVSVLPDNAACLLFTSGSTGQPQGVLVTHRNAVAYVRGLATLGLPVGASHLLAQPPTFDSSMTAVLGALAGGGALHVVDEDTARDPHALADFLAAHPTDFMTLTPSHLAALLADGDTRALRPNEAVVLGGEPIGSALATRLLADGWGVIAHYGRTETTIGVSARRLTRGDQAPIGRPLPGVRAYVLDRRQQPVPPGCRGELYVGGPQVTRGYRGSAAATAAAFVPDPFTAEPGARMYRTGDLVRRSPDGSLMYCGRTDRQARIRGCRIESGAVEAALGITGPTVVRVPITDRTAVGEYAIEWTDDACLLSFDPSQVDDLSIGMTVESLPCGPGEIADAPGVLVPQKTMDALAGEAHDAYDTTTTDLVVAATMAAACVTAVAVAETGVVRVDPRPDAASLVRAVRAAMRSAHDDDPAVPGVRVIPLPETAAVTEIGTAGDRVIVTLAGSRVLVSGAADAGLGERVRDRLVALVAHCVDAEPVYSAADLDDAGVAALLAALDADVSP